MSSSVACVCFIGVLFGFVCFPRNTSAHTCKHVCICLSYLYLSSIFLTVSGKGESLKNSKRTDHHEAATGCNNIFQECFLLGKWETCS